MLLKSFWDILTNVTEMNACFKSEVGNLRLVGQMQPA